MRLTRSNVDGLACLQMPEVRFLKVLHQLDSVWPLKPVEMPSLHDPAVFQHGSIKKEELGASNDRGEPAD